MIVEKVFQYRIRFFFVYCFFALMCLSLITLSPQTSLAQIGSTINGMVFDAGRKALTDVDVELQDEYSRLISRTRTTSGGRFIFRGLVSGSYRVRIMGNRLGFAEQSQEVQIISFSRSTITAPSNDQVYVDFYLQPIKKASLAETFGIASSVFVQNIPSEAIKSYKQAISDFDQKKDDLGLVNLKKAIKIFPTYFDALNRFGEELIKQQDFKAAQEILTKAVEVNPKDAGAFYLLGYCQYVLKQFDSAAKTLDQSVNWFSKSAPAYLLLGMSLRQIKRYEEAELRMKKAKELAKKKLPDVHWQLALLYGNNLKRFNEAADELELFLKVQPDSKDAESIKKLIQQFRNKARQG